MKSSIEVLDHVTVWDNPTPTFCSRHAYFPGMVKLASGEILAMFPIGQAFEASDHRIHVSRSADGGRTWSEAALLHPRIPKALGSLKATPLDDGTLVAVGYMFQQRQSGVWINPKTGGMPPGGRNWQTRSGDGGRTWELPRRLRHSRPDVLEVSGPCLQLRGGGLLAVGTPIPEHDGSRPSGVIGVALRSADRGETWDDRTVYFNHPPISPLEARLCQMDDGRVVAIVWALDETSGVCHRNHVVVSRDNGLTWGEPIDTGIPGQASNLVPLRGDLLLSVHAQREKEPVGVFVRVVDFAGDRWNVLAEESAWSRAPAMKVSGYLGMGGHLRFGQPSLLDLGGGEFLAYHWAIENGQGRILGHRLRVSLG